MKMKTTKLFKGIDYKVPKGIKDLDELQNWTYDTKDKVDKKIKKIEVAVLVDRSHTAFPIKATYVGYELSTTLSDNIQVVLKGKKGVYLN